MDYKSKNKHSQSNLCNFPVTGTFLSRYGLRKWEVKSLAIIREGIKVTGHSLNTPNGGVFSTMSESIVRIPIGLKVDINSVENLQNNQSSVFNDKVSNVNVQQSNQIDIMNNNKKMIIQFKFCKNVEKDLSFCYLFVCFDSRKALANFVTCVNHFVRHFWKDMYDVHWMPLEKLSFDQWDEKFVNPENGVLVKGIDLPVDVFNGEKWREIRDYDAGRDIALRASDIEVRDRINIDYNVKCSTLSEFNAFAKKNSPVFEIKKFKKKTNSQQSNNNNDNNAINNENNDEEYKETYWPLFGNGPKLGKIKQKVVVFQNVCVFEKIERSICSKFVKIGANADNKGSGKGVLTISTYEQRDTDRPTTRSKILHYFSFFPKELFKNHVEHYVDETRPFSKSREGYLDQNGNYQSQAFFDFYSFHARREISNLTICLSLNTPGGVYYLFNEEGTDNQNSVIFKLFLPLEVVAKIPESYYPTKCSSANCFRLSSFTWRIVFANPQSKMEFIDYWKNLQAVNLPSPLPASHYLNTLTKAQEKII